MLPFKPTIFSFNSVLLVLITAKQINPFVQKKQTPLTTLHYKVQFDLWFSLMRKPKKTLRFKTLHKPRGSFYTVYIVLKQKPFSIINKHRQASLSQSCQRLRWLVTVATHPWTDDWRRRGCIQLLAKQLITAAAEHSGSGAQTRTEQHPDGLWTCTSRSALRDWIDLPSMISANTGLLAGGSLQQRVT